MKILKKRRIKKGKLWKKETLKKIKKCNIWKKRKILKNVVFPSLGGKTSKDSELAGSDNWTKSDKILKIPNWDEIEAQVGLESNNFSITRRPGPSLGDDSRERHCR